MIEPPETSNRPSLQVEARKIRLALSLYPEFLLRSCLRLFSFNEHNICIQHVAFLNRVPRTAGLPSPRHAKSRTHHETILLLLPLPLSLAPFLFPLINPTQVLSLIPAALETACSRPAAAMLPVTRR